jgi:hypothetical protein
MHLSALRAILSMAVTPLMAVVRMTTRLALRMVVALYCCLK